MLSGFVGFIIGLITGIILTCLAQVGRLNSRGKDGETSGQQSQ